MEKGQDEQLVIIKKLTDLYIIQRGHYLVQYPEPVGYRTYKKGKVVNGKKVKPLMDWHIENHLNGKFTIGTFSKFFSKFMTFDVDFRDREKAKWITYKLAHTLTELGVTDFYISFSGSKGYHIDLFFENLIKIDDAKRFFDFVITQSDIIRHSDDGQVEFWPTDKHGVKIPLGIHQKTGNFCGFCSVEDGLKVMTKKESLEYLFTINKMKHEAVLSVIGMDNIESIDKQKLIKTEEAISPHKSLESYEQSEDYSIDQAKDLFLNGLKAQGSRNNAAFRVGLYLKYHGLNAEQVKIELRHWMNWQNKKLYSTPLEQCYNEIDTTVKTMFNKNYNLSPGNKDLTVSFNEIKWIMDSCPEKNQKLITYAMLIHSKRHANMQGVFYMPFSMIQQATGLYDQAVQRQINKLAELGVIEIVQRNRKQSGTTIKKANLYKLPRIESVNLQGREVFVTDNMEDIKSCLKFYFTEKELKSMLRRRQYESMII